MTDEEIMELAAAHSNYKHEGLECFTPQRLVEFARAAMADLKAKNERLTRVVERRSWQIDEIDKQRVAAEAALAVKNAELAEARADALKVGDQMLAEKLRADRAEAARDAELATAKAVLGSVSAALRDAINAAVEAGR